MSFSHSAYSTMNTNAAKDILTKRGMMKKKMPTAGGNKRATSSHTANVTVPDSDEEYEEEVRAANNASDDDEEEAVPVTWECPQGGCSKVLEIGDAPGKKSWPKYKFKRDGSYYPAYPSYWLCYPCSKELKDKGEHKDYKLPEDFKVPEPPKSVLNRQRGESETAKKGKEDENLPDGCMSITVKFIKSPKEQPSARFVVVKSATSGLNWAESTDQGTQEDLLKNAALQKALMQKSKFSDKEWASFGIKKLRSDHWMRVGESIWRPAAETAFDVKLLLARKFQLPRPDVRNDSKSRMLRLQGKRGNSWELLDDDTPLEDDLHEFQFELKAMKLDKASFIDMMLNEKTGLTKLYQMLDKKVKFKGKGNEAADLRLLMSMYRQWCHNLCPVLSFDDCIEKVESVGNTLRVQAALEMIREQEQEKYLPTAAMETENAARNLSDEMDDKASEDVMQEEQDAGTSTAAVPPGPAAARAGVGDEMEEEEDDMVPDPEEYDEYAVEEDVGDEYAELDEDEYIRPVAAAPVVAQPAPVATAAPVLSEEQKARIARNRELAMQRLAERDAAKAAETAAASAAPAEPAAVSARGAAPDASPVPSAPSSRLGSPRSKRSSSRASASVVVRHTTPSMERLAAKRAAASASAGTDHGGSGGDNGGAAQSAAHTADTAVSEGAGNQAGAADEELVSPSKRARTDRGSGPTADEETRGTRKSDEEMEEDFDPADADMEDEGAAYVDDSDLGPVVSSSAAAPAVAAASPKATAASAETAANSPAAALAKSPLSSVSPVAAMPVGSQNAESPNHAGASGEVEGGGADTLETHTLVYDDKLEEQPQQTQCEGTLVYTEGAPEGTLVYEPEQQQRSQTERMPTETESGEQSMAAQEEGDGGDLGLVEDFV